MIEHGVCGKCTDGIDENHHLKVQHQSRIQELTTVQSQRRKPGPKSRQIATNTLNSAGESNSDESMDQMEIMDKIIESDEDEIPNCSPENLIFISDPKVNARIFKHFHQQYFLSSILFYLYSIIPIVKYDFNLNGL